MTASLAVPAVLPVERLSHTALSRFWKCPESFRRRYIDRRPDPVGGAATIGKAVGAAVTVYYQARIQGHKGDDHGLAGHAHDAYQAEWPQVAAEAKFKEGEDPDRLRDQGAAALAAYLEQIAPQVRPVAVERKFELRFPGARWVVVGYIDVDEADGGIRDLKVKAKHLSQADADSDPQAGLYLLDRRARGHAPGRFTFDSTRRGKNPDAKAVPTSRTVAQLDALQARIAMTARAIAYCWETGDWSYSAPGGWWCSQGYCAYWQACPAGGQGRPVPNPDPNPEPDPDHSVQEKPVAA